MSLQHCEGKAGFLALKTVPFLCLKAAPCLSAHVVHGQDRLPGRGRQPLQRAGHRGHRQLALLFRAGWLHSSLSHSNGNMLTHPARNRSPGPPTTRSAPPTPSWAPTATPSRCRSGPGPKLTPRTAANTCARPAQNGPTHLGLWKCAHQHTNGPTHPGLLPSQAASDGAPVNLVQKGGEEDVSLTEGPTDPTVFPLSPESFGAKKQHPRSASTPRGSVPARPVSRRLTGGPRVFVLRRHDTVLQGGDPVGRRAAALVSDLCAAARAANIDCPPPRRPHSPRVLCGL